MVGYEYKIIPAPAKGLKAPGIKGAEARFANALEQRINDLAAEGWEYLRADILPSEERQGLTSTQIVYRSVLVFRRDIDAASGNEVPVAVVTAKAEKRVEPVIRVQTEPTPESAATDDPQASTEGADEAPEDDRKPG